MPARWLPPSATFLAMRAVTGLGAATRHRQLAQRWSSGSWGALLRLDRLRLLLALAAVLALAVWNR